ncbi:MAG: hypothetical protein Q4P18_07125 [Methanobrevibacter sp.]|uniref:hypothetical protein n=1 Tax=Methanobrevibacter sp. TaxID=66852 RepID=UPI0026E0FA78|nr:hypothetical protein [Methanobrevibacter sp.]MDO5849289.1 hypothetical protein [Methanobrevibacter sp.]
MNELEELKENYEYLTRKFNELSIKRTDETLTKKELVAFINECKKINPEIPDFIDGSKSIHLTAAYVGTFEE